MLVFNNLTNSSFIYMHMYSEKNTIKDNEWRWKDNAIRQVGNITYSAILSYLTISMNSSKLCSTNRTQNHISGNTWRVPQSINSIQILLPIRNFFFDQPSMVSTIDLLITYWPDTTIFSNEWLTRLQNRVQTCFLKENGSLFFLRVPKGKSFKDMLNLT